MSILESIIIGIVEGVTEFLPISSTAHMDIARHFLNVPASDFVKSFEIIIQFAAILAVVWLFRKNIFSSFRLYFTKVMIAFIPTGIIGFLLYKLIKEFLLGNLWIASVALVVGGITILLFEKMHGVYEEEERSFNSLTNKELLIMGLSQSFAVIPGVSRSLAVILSGRSLGISKVLVTEFSFLLAIPTMFFAAAYDVYKSGFAFANNDWLALLVGFAISFITAVLSINWLVGYIKSHSFSVFGWYRIILGAVLFIIIVL